MVIFSFDPATHPTTYLIKYGMNWSVNTRIAKFNTNFNYNFNLSWDGYILIWSSHPATHPTHSIKYSINWSLQLPLLLRPQRELQQQLKVQLLLPTWLELGPTQPQLVLLFLIAKLSSSWAQISIIITHQYRVFKVNDINFGACSQWNGYILLAWNIP